MDAQALASILLDNVEIARRAKRLKGDFLDAFFEEKSAQLFEAMKDLPLGADAVLKDLHHQLKSLNALQVEIETFIDTGKISQSELDKKDK